MSKVILASLIAASTSTPAATRGEAVDLRGLGAPTPVQVDIGARTVGGFALDIGPGTPLWGQVTAKSVLATLAALAAEKGHPDLTRPARVEDFRTALREGKVVRLACAHEDGFAVAALKVKADRLLIWAEPVKGACAGVKAKATAAAKAAKAAKADNDTGAAVNAADAAPKGKGKGKGAATAAAAARSSKAPAAPQAAAQEPIPGFAGGEVNAK